MNEQRGNGRNSMTDDRLHRMQHEQSIQEQRRYRDDDNRFGEDRERSQRYGSSDHGFGQGQSGYMAGRHADDRSLGRQGINQGDERSDDPYSQRMGFGMRGGDETGGGWYGGGGGGQGGRMSMGYRGGLDDRWSGRGGEDYARGYGDQSRQSGAGFGPERGGGYGRSFGGEGSENMNRGYAGSGEQRMQSHRGKGPKNFQRSDERLKELVSEALSDDHDIDASEIEIEVKNGEVTLKGTVEDRRTKRMAEDCVERIPGIQDVQNQIKVGSGNKWQVSTRGNQNQGSQVGTGESEKSKHRA